MRPPRKDLTDRERLFCDSYVTHLQGARAAIEAGYSCQNVNDYAVLAARILRRPAVRRFLDAHLAKRVATKQELLGELSDIATAPWRDFLTIIRDEEGNAIDVKLRLTDKVRAIETLLKAQGHMRDPLTRLLDALLEREVKALGKGRDEVKVKVEGPPPPALLAADTIDAELVERELPREPAQPTKVGAKADVPRGTPKGKAGQVHDRQGLPRSGSEK